MTRTISSTELRDNLDAKLADARSGEPVIVEKDGAPDVVMISAIAFKRFLRCEESREADRAEEQRQFEALESQLEEEPDRVLSDVEIELIAVHVGREIRASLNRQGREGFAETRTR